MAKAKEKKFSEEEIRKVCIALRENSVPEELSSLADIISTELGIQYGNGKPKKWLVKYTDCDGGNTQIVEKVFPTRENCEDMIVTWGYEKCQVYEYYGIGKTKFVCEYTS